MALTPSERVARWRERHPEAARKRWREDSRRYRERRRRLERLLTTSGAEVGPREDETK